MKKENLTMAHECHRHISAITSCSKALARKFKIWRISETVNGKKTKNLETI